MEKKSLSLSHFLKKRQSRPDEDLGSRLEKLQHHLLLVQQGLWHRKERAIVLFEGFDAAGKGGAIRTLTEKLDPRGVQVHPIGPPTAIEQEQHYLQRFWQKLPPPGVIAVFDRSWYGRVLVEKVEKLAPPERLREAYEEIRQFEGMLRNDGIRLLKFFLAISPDEQLRRYEDRMNDPYKRWKLGESDLQARRQWNAYVKATDKLFQETHTKKSPWFLVGADNKDQARVEILKETHRHLAEFELWLQTEADHREQKKINQELRRMIKSFDAKY